MEIDLCVQKYDPYAKKIQLLTGDNLAIHFLYSLGKKEKTVNFYNTVESDLQIKIFAESQGWRQTFTCRR